MLIKFIFYLIHSLFSILPNADAAAVWISPLCPVDLVLWINPKTVKGLTIPDAAEFTKTSASITNKKCDTKT